MQKKNRHLREEDRGVIYRMNKAGKPQRDIAEAIGFSQSSVSKELKRNAGKRGYREKQAEMKAAKRKSGKRSRPSLMTGRLKERVDEALELRHSPDQISGALKLEGIHISHETIYGYILSDKAEGGKLYQNLRINSKRRYRRRAKEGRVGKIPDRVGIEERPKAVDGHISSKCIGLRENQRNF